MIKKIESILLIVVIALASTVHAQDKSGIITYKGVINQKHVDSFLTDLKAKKDVPMHIKQGVVSMYMNATPDEYKLNFKNEESYYYKIPALDAGENYNMGSKAGKNPYYINNGTNTIIEMSSSLGNIAHSPLDWKITRKTKDIGGYKCYQALATERLYSRRGHYYTREVVAWFAPEIPLSFGPKHYNGLPGLILEINRPEFTISALKIKLNPEEDIEIKRLDRNNKVITQKEAHNRIKELMDDRQKRR